MKKYNNVGKKGFWVAAKGKGYGYSCSLCKCRARHTNVWEGAIFRFNFCPRCGAKMLGIITDDENVPMYYGDDDYEEKNISI